ncbi:IS21-like element helper ATPase IstB [Bdellovibrionota bacterium FG-2]
MPMSMTEIEQTLRVLRLPGIRETFGARALEAAQGHIPFVDAFSMLLQDELDRRKTKLVERRFALSGLTEKKTLSEFDWSFNPKVPRRACFELTALKFITNREDAILLGPPGTGKSHIAKAVAHAAILAGHRVFYREAHKLFIDVFQAKTLGTFKKLAAQIQGADLVCIDDLFLRKLPVDAGDEFIEIVMNRYEKASTMITSIRPIQDWPKLDGDVLFTAPVFDRLIHHGNLLKFEGRSYRMKEATNRVAKKESSD